MLPIISQAAEALKKENKAKIDIVPAELWLML